MEEEEQAQLRRNAAAQMGRAKTQKKTDAVRENGKLGGRPTGSGSPLSEATKARMQAAQQSRRQQEREQKDAPKDAAE